MTNVRWIMGWIQGVACLLLLRKVWKMKPCDDARFGGLMQLSWEKIEGSEIRMLPGMEAAGQISEADDNRMSPCKSFALKGNDLSNLSVQDH